MIERLPTPWGLVRLGVAPDHPKIKSVSRAFEKIAEQPGFRFLGNVEVGRDLHHADLQRLYDAVVYSVGAQSDRRMGIPGEDLPGSWPATEFVAWYNGHPDHQQLDFDLSGKRAVVVGAGQRRRRRRPDARAHAGRAGADRHDRCRDRGDLQLRDRGDRDGRPPRPGAGRLHDAGADRARRARRCRRDRRPGRPRVAHVAKDTNAERNLEVLRVAARRPENEAASGGAGGKPKRLVLRFFRSPVEILGDGKVEAVAARPQRAGRERASRPDRREETLACGLVFRSVGYRGVALPEVPFDERRGTIPQRGRPRARPRRRAPSRRLLRRLDQARPLRRDRHEQEGRDRDRRAAARGRRGRADRAQRRPRLRRRGAARRAGSPLRRVPGWAAIDDAERTAGEKLGRPRVKLCSWEDLLAAAERAASRT